ncbi:MAG: class I SAM-dependent methyltransferase [Verrucomicrobiota bacterium]
MKVFFQTEFDPLESMALDLCRGKILDVGAAAGRHSIELRRRGLRVCALDILSEAAQILSDRGVTAPIVGDILHWSGDQFDTVLMLMNGIGLVGTPEKLDEFLCHAPNLLTHGGQIICDSIDVSVSQTPTHVAYRENNLRKGLYPGQQCFSISYAGQQGEIFPWLHLDAACLSQHCRKANLDCNIVHKEADGHYLVSIMKRSG